MRGKKKRQMRSFSSSTQAMPHLVQQEALKKVQKSMYRTKTKQYASGMMSWNLRWYKHEAVPKSLTKWVVSC
jgi:hypothetical protein